MLNESDIDNLICIETTLRELNKYASMGYNYEGATVENDVSLMTRLLNDTYDFTSIDLRDIARIYNSLSNLEMITRTLKSIVRFKLDESMFESMTREEDEEDEEEWNNLNN